MAKRARKRKLNSEDHEMDEWERVNILPDELRDEMETMWEIPQICHFLYLTREALNVGNLSMYEMERMLLMPRASKQLANIMTSLLSSQMCKGKLRRIPPMPYEYWTNILMHKIKSWFKVYHGKHQDSVKALEAIGVEPEFWTIFPDVSNVEGKDFEELTFKQRVWLLKTVCDTIMHSRRTVQEEIAKQQWEDQFETSLGTDRHGARYIYFPQFVEHDVRVYRHCLDNKVLSTVMPPKLKAEPGSAIKTASEQSLDSSKSRKGRRRKPRWQNGALPSRGKKRNRKKGAVAKSCTNCSTTHSVIGCLANEDTNLSGVSVCSNNNHSSIDGTGLKRSRSSSKNSEGSAVSHETKSSRTKSSGYDTNTSNDAKSIDEMLLEKDFKGFAREIVEKQSDDPPAAAKLCDINSEDWKPADTSSCTFESIDSESKQPPSTDTREETTIAEADQPNDSRLSDFSLSREILDSTSSDRNLYDSALASTSSCKEIANAERTSFEEMTDVTMMGEDVSNSSKTDDEKLNEILSNDVLLNVVKTDHEIVPESQPNGVEAIDKEASEAPTDADPENMEKILTTCKSDDEKLIETKSGSSREDEENVLDDTWESNSSNRKLDRRNSCSGRMQGGHTVQRIKYRSKSRSEENAGESNRTEASERKKRKSDRRRSKPPKLTKMIEEKSVIPRNDVYESETEEELSLSTSMDKLLRGNAQGKVRQRSGCDETPSWEWYNLRKPRKMKKEKPEEVIENFDEFLADLSFSTFELVADSIESLRDLVASFSSESADQIGNLASSGHSLPQCEISLVQNIQDLIDSLVKTEPSLTCSTKKARTKLHKEWTNFKDGVVEDQDWSSEGGLGLGSNWWVLGSQGCFPLPPTGDAAVPSLPQATIPPPGTQNHDHPSTDPEQQPQDQDQQQQQTVHQQNQGQSSEQSQDRDSEHQQSQEKEGRGNEPDKKELEQQSRRVLRARGVSSYTEQLYSDDEVDEDQLEGWSEVEAMYAPPCAPPGTPVVNAPTPGGQTDPGDSADSDQDWILPGSRKRKSKRPAASRRLKTFQNKLQNIKVESFENLMPPNLTANVPQDGRAEILKPRRMSTNESHAVQFPQTLDASYMSSLRKSGANVTAVDSKQAVPSETICKIENVQSVHSELDIKEEIQAPETDQGANNYNLNVQQGYVVVKTEHGPMTNFYLMHQNPAGPGIVQQSSMMPNVVPQVPASYYVQGAPNYIVQGQQQSSFIPGQSVQQNMQQSAAQPHSQQSLPHNHQHHTASQNLQQIMQQNHQQVLAQQNHQQLVAQQNQQHIMGHSVAQNYVHMQPTVPNYVISANAQQNFPAAVQHPPPPPRGYFLNPGLRQNFMTAQNVRMLNRQFVQQRPTVVRNNVPFPNGAVIRSNVPIRGNFPRQAGVKGHPVRPAIVPSNGPKPLRKIRKKPAQLSASGSPQKTTSLIVLSDSDDDIEMIITEPPSSQHPGQAKGSPQKQKVTTQQASKPPAQRQKPVVTSQITVPPTKSILPPQIMQRMNQGGISITPVKPSVPPLTNPNTQLVVVVNETGSHYALSLPNGSRLILTPEQVAQIRASNGGKLML